jgi:hypothetical protein
MTVTKIKQASFPLLAGICILANATSAIAQELVTNGSFETGSFSGWATSGNLAGTSVISNPLYVHSGTYGAQLGAANTLGFISQNLVTTSTKKYVLSLWLNSPDGASPNEFKVSWNGTVIFDQANIGNIGWTNLVFTNTATGTSTPLQIGFRDDPSYLGLDDVSVVLLGQSPPTIKPPINDNFASPLVISTAFYQFATTNLGATRETGEPDNGAPFYDANNNFTDPGGEGHTSVWWSYTAPGSGYMDITVSPATFNPLIAVYQGTVVTNLNLIVSSSQGWGVPGTMEDILANNVHFNVASGAIYRIAVDGYAQSSGSFTFTSQFTPTPGNDNFASRITLPAAFSSVIGSNGAASLQTGEPVHSGTSPGASVWWSWTPTTTGNVTLTTVGSSFDTILDVYTGTVLSSLARVASNDNAAAFTNTLGPTFDPLSRTNFNVTAGTAYQICVSGANGETGNIVLNNLSAANGSVFIDALISSKGRSNADGTLAFTNVIDLSNLRATASGPLRVSLWTKPGYNYQAHLLTDYQLIASQDVPEQLIGVTNFPATGTLGAGTKSQFTVSGICPAPFYYTNFPTVGSPQVIGVGYSVLATLEEQTNSVWVTRDSRAIIVGNWPLINDFIGINGGVVTLNSSLNGSTAAPTFLQVNFGPPAAVRLGGLWRFSPTNYGNRGEFRYFTNFFARTNLTLLVQSTNFSVEMASLPGFTSTSSSAVSFTNGSIVPLNILYSVLPPRMVFNRIKGAGMVGTVGTAYNIQTTTNPTNAATWTLVTNNVLAAGTNWVTNTSLSTGTNRFYRAVWLTN